MYTGKSVSVIVPIYNQEQYLDLSIPTLLNQSYHNLDIVLVNDGSTDKSTEIIRRYADQDNRIQIIDKPNGGLVDATLAGVQAAKGEFICFLDPDDLLGADFVQVFMDAMTDNCDFVAAGIYYDNHGVHTKVPLLEDRAYSEEELHYYRQIFLHEPGIEGISNRFFISRCNKLYRTELIKKVSEHFHECKGATLGEDTIFTYLMLQFAKGGKTIARPNSYYYNIGNQHSMMNTGTADIQIKKSHTAYQILRTMTERFHDSQELADVLYYFLVSTVLRKVRNSSRKQFIILARKLKQDAQYCKGRMLVVTPRTGLRGLKDRLTNEVHSPILCLLVEDFIKFSSRFRRGS